MVRIKEIRLKQYDYRTDGYYFVTAVCNLRENFLQDNEKIVEAQLSDLISKTQGLELDYFIIMPDHVHIIFVLSSSEISLGEIVRRFKAKVSHALNQNVWQPNFYEHVIRNELALQKIREYIINNPKELLLKFDQFYQ